MACHNVVGHEWYMVGGISPNEGRDVMTADQAADDIGLEQGQEVLTASQAAWNTRDLEALLRVLDADITIDFNFVAPIRGFEAARAWLTERFDVQLDYRLVKELRGVYGRTVVCHWTGTWHESDGHHYRNVGIELLTLNAQSRVIRWEATMDKERVGTV
jgi:nuclear transport factor 2 (NTF2) superfamily protein